jgi:hypothetical protein
MQWVDCRAVAPAVQMKKPGYCCKSPCLAQCICLERLRQKPEAPDAVVTDNTVVRYSVQTAVHACIAAVLQRAHRHSGWACCRCPIDLAKVVVVVIVGGLCGWTCSAQQQTPSQCTACLYRLFLHHQVAVDMVAYYGSTKHFTWDIDMGLFPAAAGCAALQL